MTVLFIHESFFVYMLFDMSFISTSAYMCSVNISTVTRGPVK